MTKLRDLPPPTGSDLVVASSPYHIGPVRQARVTVFGVPELSGKFEVDAAARLSLPLAGTIEAAGLTLRELAQAIDGRLRGNFVKNPQVSVNLEETTSQVYTVDGQVSQPGSYPALGNITLMRAVANAKGAGEFARLDDVVVFRSVNGRPMAALYNLGAIRSGLPRSRIYANDIVVVGDSKASRMFQQFLQMFPLLTPRLVVGAGKAPLMDTISPHVLAFARGPDSSRSRAPPPVSALPSIRRLIRAASRWRWVLLGRVALGAVAGILITALMTREYRPPRGSKSRATPTGWSTSTVSSATPVSQIRNSIKLNMAYCRRRALASGSRASSVSPTIPRCSGCWVTRNLYRLAVPTFLIGPRVASR